MAELSNTTRYLHSPSTMMTATIREAATSQEAIGWTEFLHGKVSLKIAQMQESYGRLAKCRQLHKQWMKQLVERLILISHSQWLFRNFMLHHKTKGYLQAKAESDIKREVPALLHTRPSNIPLNCQYLLEIKHPPGRSSSHKFQRYWVRSMKAARVAIDREGRRLASLGSSAKWLESGQQQSIKKLRRVHKRRHQQSRNIVEGVRETLARELQINPPLRKWGKSLLQQQGAKKTRLGQ
jgi:hypothetical protein